MLHCLAGCFTTCMKHGIFPSRWKIADLVLIPKGESTPGELPKVRPICLLDEVGKTFERLIASRLLEFMNGSPLADCAELQFGFRKMRSTIDALQFVRKTVGEAVAGGRFVAAISLDIKNAFNSMPWSAIRRAIQRKGFPAYLTRIISAYLSDRWICFPIRNGPQRRRVCRGVPQGSVLGPLL